MSPRLSRNQRSVALSAALHLLLFAPLLLPHRIHIVAVRHPGTARGTVVTFTYAPGRAPLQAEVAAAKKAPSLARTAAQSTAVLPQPLAANAAAGMAHPDSAAGGDSLAPAT